VVYSISLLYIVKVAQVSQGFGGLFYCLKLSHIMKNKMPMKAALKKVEASKADKKEDKAAAKKIIANSKKK